MYGILQWYGSNKENTLEVLFMEEKGRTIDLKKGG